MPAQRLSMRKIREVLRLKFDSDLSNRKISKCCGISRPTVADYLRRLEVSGLSWPLPDDLSDESLERQLFPPPPEVSREARSIPDWAVVHREMRKKGVTLFLLWQEYREASPNGYQYSWFCRKYHAWTGKVDLVMRQEHHAGEKMFVDYAGHTVPIIDSHTGEVRDAQIFVSVLGASSYTYAEATWTQSLPDWIGSHVRAFSFFGGVPEIVVPDNLKSGVSKACRYEPDLNPTYQDLASHYQTVVLPARTRKPRDKAKVETAVLVVERWILARLRNHRFFSLVEANQAIRKVLVELNDRPFKKIPGSRKTLFESLDKVALKQLPVQPYQYAEWKKARVHIDYHVEIARHYYSVPFQLVKKQIDVRISANTVECFYKGARVASHLRNNLKGRHTTSKEHMPPAHKHYAKWSPERFIRWANSIGPQTAELVEKIIASRPHPQQAYRSILGILRLEKSYDTDRLEKACTRALHLGTTSYRSIESILKNGLEKKNLHESTEQIPLFDHDNIRGPHYYKQTH